MPAAVEVLPAHAFLGHVPRSRAWSGFAFKEVVDRADQDIPRHTHSDAHFFLLLRGKYLSEARGVDGVCEPGTLLFVPPGTTHRDRFVTRGGSFFAASVEPELLRRIAGDVMLSELASRVGAPLCRQLSHRLYDELRDGDDFSPAIMAGITIEMLAWTVRAATISDRKPPRWLQRALEQIEKSPEMPSVTALAGDAGVHPLHFARTFRKFQRCSPGEYLRQRRADRAAELIMRTRMPLAEIAGRAGFADQSHLTKAMRRYFGVTPAELRRRVGR